MAKIEMKTLLIEENKNANHGALGAPASRRHFPGCQRDAHAPRALQSVYRLCILFLFVILLSAGPVSAFQIQDQPAALFEQGNSAYQEGNYTEAESLYLKILESDYENAPLYFNLGNACFKQKKLGEAIYYWEKARQLTPADRDILDNLELANLLIVDKIEIPEDPFPVRILKGARDLFTISTESFLVIILFIAANILFFLYCTLKNPRHAFRALMIFFAAGFLFILLSGSLAWKVYDRDYVRKGIVLEQRVDVLSGPGEENITVFTIHEGIKVRVHGSGSGWYQISLPNGWNGWLPQDTVRIL